MRDSEAPRAALYGPTPEGLRGARSRATLCAMFERDERDGVRVLRMAHGKANALDLELLAGLAEELADFARSPARALVLTGRGSIFSAGVDLVRLLAGGAAYVREFLPELDRALLELFALEKPVVAAVNGHAIAGGCVIACGCDLRVMARGKGRIGAPELLVGVPFPPVALELVRRLVSPASLDETLLAGRTWTAEEALARGLADELADGDAEGTLARAVERARALAAIPARSFALTKRQLRLPLRDHLERRGEQMQREVVEAWTSDEVLGAIAAYVKRTLGK